MRYGHDQDEKFSVLDSAENSVVADSVAPKSSQICFETFAESAGIGITGNAFIKVGNDVALRLFAEFA
jgi:hypothetical protein